MVAILALVESGDSVRAFMQQELATICPYLYP